MVRNEIFSWALKLWLITTIGFLLFCLGRGFSHFPKHEKQAEAVLPAEVEVYEAVKTAGNSYERIRRVR